MAAVKEPSFLCEFCGAKVDKHAIKCNTCGHLFDSIKCPSCGFQGKADAFPNGCPKCGYQSSSLDELRKKIIDAQEDSNRERKIAIDNDSKNRGGRRGNLKVKGGLLSFLGTPSPKKRKPKNQPWFSRGTYIIISIVLLFLIGAMGALLYFLLLLE